MFDLQKTCHALFVPLLGQRSVCRSRYILAPSPRLERSPEWQFPRRGCWGEGGTARMASAEPQHPAATSCPVLPLLLLGGRATELQGLENQAGIYSSYLFQPVVFQQKERIEALKGSRVRDPRVIPLSYTSISISLWSSARNLLNSCS